MGSVGPLFSNLLLSLKSSEIYGRCVCVCVIIYSLWTKKKMEWVIQSKPTTTTTTGHIIIFLYLFAHKDHKILRLFFRLKILDVYENESTKRGGRDFVCVFKT